LRENLYYFVIFEFRPQSTFICVNADSKKVPIRPTLLLSRYDPGTGKLSLYKTTDATLGYTANLKELGSYEYMYGTHSTIPKGTM